MLSFLFMKLLESYPPCYDRGLRLLSLGRLAKSYDRLAAWFYPEQHVLDLGCGSGALTLRAAARGARVTGMDINPRMLALARENADRAGLSARVELYQRGVAELGGEEAESYDTVVSGLCLSELSAGELEYTLVEIRRILKPGGLFCVADEVRPVSLPGRLLQDLMRLPLAALALLSARRSTRPLIGWPQYLEGRGFRLRSCRLGGLGGFMELAAEKAGPA
jgi:ubiquinone/menaquinone biosynthesis C-methylase UbiE